MIKHPNRRTRFKASKYSWDKSKTHEFGPSLQTGSLLERYDKRKLVSLVYMHLGNLEMMISALVATVNFEIRYSQREEL